MSLKLTLHTKPEVPLEAAAISPSSLVGMNAAAITALQLHHGNQAVSLGDFFKVEGEADATVHVEGDLSLVKHLGSGMSGGNLHLHGDAGVHLGAGMSGGEIVVEGNAADWVGPEMSGGRIIIRGNAGHMVGSAYRGSATGMTGGEIIVHGSVRNEAGHAMRNGLIMVGGDSGDFTGVNMLAGTILVAGTPGIRTAAGMKRGTIISLHMIETLPTFSYSCLYHPVVINMLLHYAGETGLSVTDRHFHGNYHRWCGDSVEQNRGEILIFAS